MDKGFRISYVVEAEQSMSVRVYNIGHERCKSNQKWGPGVRNFYLLHHVISGKGYYIAEGKQYDITAGSTFIIYPDTNITYYADKDDPWEYYWVGFIGNDARLILDMTLFSPKNHVVNLEVSIKLKEILTKIMESRGRDECYKVKMSGYLMLALSLFIKKDKESINNLSALYCKKAAEYIAYNYYRAISIKDIADYIRISRSQLYRVFLQCFNKSPIQFITEYRIEQALRLLKNSNLSINEIAYSVGFDDNLYFSRVFKKITGNSPSGYRKN